MLTYRDAYIVFWCCSAPGSFIVDGENEAEGWEGDMLGLVVRCRTEDSSSFQFYGIQ